MDPAGTPTTVGLDPSRSKCRGSRDLLDYMTASPDRRPALATLA